MSVADVDRIREVNAAITARDLSTVAEGLHPDVVWEHNLGAGSLEEGTYRGRENVIALLERILEPWEYLRVEPDEIRDGRLLRGKMISGADRAREPESLEGEPV